MLEVQHRPSDLVLCGCEEGCEWADCPRAHSLEELWAREARFVEGRPKVALVDTIHNTSLVGHRGWRAPSIVLCHFWRRGKCRLRGCPHSHSVEELWRNELAFSAARMCYASPAALENRHVPPSHPPPSHHAPPHPPPSNAPPPTPPAPLDLDLHLGDLDLDALAEEGRRMFAEWEQAEAEARELKHLYACVGVH